MLGAQHVEQLAEAQSSLSVAGGDADSAAAVATKSRVGSLGCVERAEQSLGRLEVKAADEHASVQQLVGPVAQPTVAAFTAAGRQPTRLAKPFVEARLQLGEGRRPAVAVAADRLAFDVMLVEQPEQMTAVLLAEHPGQETQTARLLEHLRLEAALVGQPHFVAGRTQRRRHSVAEPHQRNFLKGAVAETLLRSDAVGGDADIVEGSPAGEQLAADYVGTKDD